MWFWMSSEPLGMGEVIREEVKFRHPFFLSSPSFSRGYCIVRAEDIGFKAKESPVGSLARMG